MQAFRCDECTSTAINQCSPIKSLDQGAKPSYCIFSLCSCYLRQLLENKLYRLSPLWFPYESALKSLLLFFFLFFVDKVIPTSQCFGQVICLHPRHLCSQQYNSRRFPEQKPSLSFCPEALTPEHDSWRTKASRCGIGLSAQQCC